MTNKEAIEMFKAIMKAEIDRLPSHYDEEVDDDVYDSTSRVDELLQLNKIVSKALEKQMQNCGNCLHAGPLQISHNTVFCFEHSCAMSSDNCCRDWIQRLGERR